MNCWTMSLSNRCDPLSLQMATQLGCKKALHILLPALMKIPVRIISIRRISMAVVGNVHCKMVSRDCISLWFVVRCIALEEWAKANAVLAKEVNIAQDRAIVKDVTGLVASSAWASGVKRLVSGWHVNTAVAQAFKVIKTGQNGDVNWIVFIKANSADCLC